MSDQTNESSTDEEEFNTFPELSDEELSRKAVAATAQLDQLIGEMTRRPGVPSDSFDVIRDSLDVAVREVVLIGYLDGGFDSEHDVLQLIIDNGGQLRGTVFDAHAAESVLRPKAPFKHDLSADCPCGPTVEEVSA